MCCRVPIIQCLLHRSHDPCTVGRSPPLTDKDVRIMGHSIHLINQETNVHRVCGQGLSAHGAQAWCPCCLGMVRGWVGSQPWVSRQEPSWGG